MRKMNVALTAALLLMSVASVDAHIETRSANAPTGPLAPGTEYTVDYTGYIHCAVMGPTEDATVEYHEGQVLTVGMTTPTNSDDELVSWLNTSTADKTLRVSDCGEEGADVGTPGPKIVLTETITFTVSELAPAFTEFTFQPGAYGESNQGGNFSAEVAYVPTFTAPTGLSFDAVSGGATATIPLTMSANANSVFNFDVSSFTIDGEEAPDGATAHIQETLNVETGIFDNGSTPATVDLHFGVGDGGHGDHDGHDMGDMDHDEGDEHDHDDEAMETPWETAEVIVSITLAAEQDATQVSEPRLVLLTFNNADEPQMEHGEGHGEEDDTNFLPGFELAAALAVLGAVAVMRRRN